MRRNTSIVFPTLRTKREGWGTRKTFSRGAQANSPAPHLCSPGHPTQLVGYFKAIIHQPKVTSIKTADTTAAVLAIFSLRRNKKKRIRAENSDDCEPNKHQEKIECTENRPKHLALLFNQRPGIMCCDLYTAAASGDDK